MSVVNVTRAARNAPVFVSRGSFTSPCSTADGPSITIVLAAAGVHRLGWRERITQYFDAHEICPAVGQGALAIEARADDQRVRRALWPLDHAPTHRAVRAERAMLRRLGGGCQVPIAAHAVAENSNHRLVGIVASLDGSMVIRAEAAGAADNPEALGVAVGDALLKQGAKAILDSIKP